MHHKTGEGLKKLLALLARACRIWTDDESPLLPSVVRSLLPIRGRGASAVWCAGAALVGGEGRSGDPVARTIFLRGLVL